MFGKKRDCYICGKPTTRSSAESSYPMHKKCEATRRVTLRKSDFVQEYKKAIFKDA